MTDRTPPNPHLAVLRLILTRADTTAAIYQQRADLIRADNHRTNDDESLALAYEEIAEEWKKLANGLRAWFDLADPPKP